MISLKVKAPAKLNLFLEITGRRADGFHELDSLFVFASEADCLSLEKAKSWSFGVKGSFAETLTQENSEDNLVMRAARTIIKELQLDEALKICLVKNLPVAAGLGGGSADAAAVLKAICQLYQKQPDQQRLNDLALQLGADVPSCLISQAQIVRGIGEISHRLTAFPGLHSVIVNPGVPLSTAAVFKSWSRDFTPARSWPQTSDVQTWFDFIQERHNCLQETAITLCPLIAEVLSEVSQTQGCHLSRMSGSGPSCFGLYKTEVEAQEAAVLLSKAHPSWWIRYAKLQ